MSVGQYLLAIHRTTNDEAKATHARCNPNAELSGNEWRLIYITINPHGPCDEQFSDETPPDSDISNDLLLVFNFDIANLCMFIKRDEVIAQDCCRTK